MWWDDNLSHSFQHFFFQTIDMANFLFVLLVFMLAYGVSRFVILNPFNKRTWGTIGELLLVPYFQIYGELFLEIPQDDKSLFYFSSFVLLCNQVKFSLPILMRSGIDGTWLISVKIKSKLDMVIEKQLFLSISRNELIL